MADIKVHFLARRSTESPVSTFIISFNDMTMKVDTELLPGQLYRLLPPSPLTHATPSQWYPFCVLAVAMRLMR